MKLRLFEDARYSELDFTKPIELGRQQPKEGDLFDATTADDGTRRVVIAWNPEEDYFSRQHLRIEPLPGGGVRVTNTSKYFPFGVVGRGELLPGEQTDLTPPFSLQRRGRTLTVESDEEDGGSLLRLAGETTVPDYAGSPAGRVAFPTLSRPQLVRVIDWLQQTIGVIQSAVGSAAFRQLAARALVEIVGMTTGRLLLRREAGWEVDADYGVADGERRAWEPSATVLNALLRDRRTVWERPASHADPVKSLLGLRTVVAAPLLGAAGDVIGALYGELRAGADFARSAGPLEAVLAELLAVGVAAGLARQRQEQEAIRSQALFEQFFTAALAAQIRENPDMLRGQTQTVTVLFADIRNSSRVAGRLAPEVTEKWIQDVLGVLSQCALDEGGVLVDYSGDQLMALWGAPKGQPDQTARAVRAGCAMVRSLDGLNARWREALGEDMDVGVGINRGVAQVGNVGSAHRFKYGALGDMVNVASRVQGLTKYLKCRLLVTKGAHAHLGPGFDSRRVCQARPVNIEPAIHLYEVASAAEGRSGLFRASEEALDDLEQGRFAAASRKAASLLEQHPGDGPVLLLIARGADALVRNGEGFDPVWVPPGK